MRFVFISIFPFFLAACSSVSGVQKQCAAADAAYLDEWNCVRSSIAQGKAGNINDTQRANYLTFGDSLADQVKSGKKSDAQAKADLATELARASTTVRGNQEATAPHICNRGGGLLVCDD